MRRETTAQQRKPGPKSRTQFTANLGDTTISSSNNSETEDAGFKTPDAGENGTEYGLEYTHDPVPSIRPSRRNTSAQAVAATAQRTPRSAQRREPSDSLSEHSSDYGDYQPSTSQAAAVQERQRLLQQQQRQQQKNKRKKNVPKQLSREQRFHREVIELCNRTDFLVPRLPFSRLVRELIHSASRNVSHITAPALEALQASTELYVTQRLEDAYMLTCHRGRVTLTANDLQLLQYLKDGR